MQNSALSTAAAAAWRDFLSNKPSLAAQRAAGWLHALPAALQSADDADALVALADLAHMAGAACGGGERCREAAGAAGSGRGVGAAGERDARGGQPRARGRGSRRGARRGARAAAERGRRGARWLGGHALGEMCGGLVALEDLDFAELDFEWIEEQEEEAEMDAMPVDDDELMPDQLLDQDAEAEAVQPMQAEANLSAEAEYWRAEACKLQDEVQLLHDTLLLRVQLVDGLQQCDGAPT